MEEETLEIKTLKKVTEMRVSLKHVKSILLDGEAKKLVKSLRGISMTPNNIMNNVFSHDYIPFSLIVENNSLELLAQNYQIFSCFIHAIEEITKNKKSISDILRYIETKN